MKKIITLIALILSFNAFSVGSDGTENKVGSDGTENKVGSDGTENKVGSDGTENKVGSDGTEYTTYCQIIPAK